MEESILKVSTPNYSLICSLALFFCFYLFSSVSFAAPANTGEELYQYYCAQCHGVKADGKGVNATEDLPTAPKDFTSPKTLPVFTDEQIVKTIVHGGPAVQLSFIMPSWAEILSDDEVELLRAYLRKTCNCKYDPEAAAKAEAEKST
jgi:cytochrome c oxidase cbb3-type subunit III